MDMLAQYAAKGAPETPPTKRDGRERAHWLFISYRHCDGGRHAAWLRDRLQGYRLPAALRRGDRRPMVVWKDTTYMRATEDIFDRVIRPALAAAEYLLVIRTPSTLAPARAPDGSPEPNWVEREVDAFLETHDVGRVIVLDAWDDPVGPSPSSRPPPPLPGALRGMESRVRRVDLRHAGSRWGRLRHRRSLAAALLDCVAAAYRLSDVEMPVLREEERRRRRNRRLSATAAVAAVLAVVGASLWGKLEADHAALQESVRWHGARGEQLYEIRPAESRLLFAHAARLADRSRFRRIDATDVRAWLGYGFPEGLPATVPGVVFDFNPASGRAIVADRDGSWRVTDVASGATLLGPVAGVPDGSAHFAGGGGAFVQSSSSGAATRLWRVGTPAHLGTWDEVLDARPGGGGQFLVRHGQEVWPVIAGGTPPANARLLRQTTSERASAAFVGPDGDWCMLDDRRLARLSAATGRPQKAILLARPYESMTASPGRRWLLLRHPNGRACDIVDPATLETRLPDVPWPATGSGPTFGGRDERYVIFPGDERTGLWDLQSRALLHETSARTVVAINPHGVLFAVKGDRTVAVHATADPDARKWTLPVDDVYELQFLPGDADALFVRSPDETLIWRFRESNRPESLRRLRGDRDAPDVVRGARAWAYADGHAVEVRGPAGRLRFDHPAPVELVSWGPGDATLWVVTRDGDGAADSLWRWPVVWPATTAGARVVRGAWHPTEPTFFLVDQEGRVTLHGLDGTRTAAPPEHVRAAARTMQEAADQYVRALYHGELFTAWSADGNRIVSAGRDGTAHVWDRRTGREYVLRHEAWVHDVDVDRAGTHAATAGYDRSVRIWGLVDGREVANLRSDDHAHRVQFSPSGRMVAVANGDGVRICDWRQNSTFAAIPVAISRRGTLRFLGEDQLILSTYGGVTLWEISPTPRELRSFPHDRCTVVAVSPDERYLVTGTQDASAQAWLVKSGEPLGPPLRLDGPCADVAFDRAGQRVVIAAGATTRIWHVPSGRGLGPPFESIAGAFVSASFSTTGDRVLTVEGGERPARVWGCSPTTRTSAELMRMAEHATQMTIVEDRGVARVDRRRHR